MHWGPGARVHSSRLHPWGEGMCWGPVPPLEGMSKSNYMVLNPTKMVLNPTKLILNPTSQMTSTASYGAKDEI